MNFSCSSGVHRNRDFPPEAEAEAEAEAVAPDDGPGLLGEAVALVEATNTENENSLTKACKICIFYESL